MKAHPETVATPLVAHVEGWRLRLPTGGGRVHVASWVLPRCAHEEHGSWWSLCSRDVTDSSDAGESSVDLCKSCERQFRFRVKDGHLAAEVERVEARLVEMRAVVARVEAILAPPEVP